MKNKKIDLNFLAKNLMILILLLFLVLGIVEIDAGAQLDKNDLKKGENLFLQAIQLFVTAESDYYKIVNLLDRSHFIFENIEDERLKYYQLARIAYLEGVVEKDRGSHEIAKKNFSLGKECIMKSLAYGDFSEGYRILADIEGQLVLYGNFYYKAKFGPGIKDFLNKALELNPENKKAYISLALYYRDAPLIAGGSRKKSKSILKEMKEILNSNEIDLFSLFMWIDTAWINTVNDREKIVDSISILDLFSNQGDIDLMNQKIEKKYLNGK